MGQTHGPLLGATPQTLRYIYPILIPCQYILFDNTIPTSSDTFLDTPSTLPLNPLTHTHPALSPHPFTPTSLPTPFNTRSHTPHHSALLYNRPHTGPQGYTLTSTPSHPLSPTLSPHPLTPPSQPTPPTPSTCSLIHPHQQAPPWTPRMPSTLTSIYRPDAPSTSTRSTHTQRNQPTNNETNR